MQIAKSFCPETLKKIGKGMLIAASGSAALGALSYLGTLKIEDAALASFIAWLVPVAVNSVNQWLKGNK